MGIQIHVVYCGAWGYEPKFVALRDQLMDEFSPNDIEVTGEGTPTQTGKFEVEVCGKLVHSKKNGDGFPNTADKMNKIIKAIKESL